MDEQMRELAAAVAAAIGDEPDSEDVTASARVWAASGFATQDAVAWLRCGVTIVGIARILYAAGVTPVAYGAACIALRIHDPTAAYYDPDTFARAIAFARVIVAAMGPNC